MKSCILLAAASVAWVAFGSVDVSATFSAHVDAETLTAIASVLGGIATLANCLLLRKRG